jgi:signal transduction histidine kinase
VSGDLSFPDARRSELDRSITQLLQNAQRVLDTQGRLRSLLKATRVVSGEIELAEVLRRIIETAVELVGAQYGAIGVIAADGTLEQFIHVGVTADVAARIGRLPEGHGLLGALIDEQEPIRLDHLRDDPRSSGTPASHPAMDSFLGVPVRVRDEVYGNLYLAESRAGGFSEEDQELIVALAATAGGAIDHARLFDESRRRQRWAAASGDVTAALLSDQGEDSLGVLAERVAALADADLVCVVRPAAGTQLRIEVARGDLADGLGGEVFEAAGTVVGRAHEGGQPVMSASEVRIGGAPPVGATMAIPLLPSRSGGVLTVSRALGRPLFTVADLEMATEFAAQASVALRLAAARSDRQALALMEDRGRIARDLHDHVIQRLFGAGLSLQSVARQLEDPALEARISDQVDALDAAIADIRTAIFTMTDRGDGDRPTLRHRLIDLASDTAGMFPEAPRLTFVGAVDLMVPDDLADDLVAVVREGLTNVARHAGATITTVTVAVSDTAVTVDVVDNGAGIDSATAGPPSGTNNLAHRALARGGSSTLHAAEPTGTRLTWTAPLPRSKDHT